MPLPFIPAIGAYELFMGGSAIIGGYMTAHAANNIYNSMQNQSTPPPPSPGSSGTSSEGDQHAAAGQGANSTSPQTPPGPQCQTCKDKKKVKFDKRQLQSKFKHASDFGVDGNYNSANADAYENALQNNLNDPATVPKGTYGYSPGSTVWFNPNTNLAIVTDANDNFLTGFKLDTSTPQYSNFMNNGVLR